MIRIERHEEVRPGIWRYTVPGFGIEGRSRQPLLDACRQIRAIAEAAEPRVRAAPRQHPRPNNSITRSIAECRDRSA